MTNRIILCSDCGAKNKIPETTAKGKAICGNCSTQLVYKGTISSPLSLLFGIITKLWFVWVLCLIIIAVPYLEDSGSKPFNSKNIYSTTETHKFRRIRPDEDIILDNESLSTKIGTFDDLIPKTQVTVQPVKIKHGTISKNYVSGVAPLEIKTRSGNSYYIKIMDSVNNQVALTAYIIGGRPFEVEVPLGTYEIRYASGDTWYGTDRYFGQNTSFSKTNELFHFTFDGYRYSGYTIELILQAHGNLRTMHIDQTDF